jgi:putative restriction endonuclease
MREVSPGDIIFSFVDTLIAAIGIAQSYYWKSPTPVEFGEAGQNWENVGWKIKVLFTTLLNKVRPKDHINVLRTVLSSRYSPLQANGNGIQSIYLTGGSSRFRGGAGRLDWRRGPGRSSQHRKSSQPSRLSA